MIYVEVNQVDRGSSGTSLRKTAQISHLGISPDLKPNAMFSVYTIASSVIAEFVYLKDMLPIEDWIIKRGLPCHYKTLRGYETEALQQCLKLI